MINLTPLINAVIAILAAVLTPRLVAWLKAKTTAEQRNTMQAWAKIAVAAAEQGYDRDRGKLKKQYVREFLATKGFDVDLEELDAAIEAAVLELHAELYKET